MGATPRLYTAHRDRGRADAEVRPYEEMVAVCRLDCVTGTTNRCAVPCVEMSRSEGGRGGPPLHVNGGGVQVTLRDGND